MTPENTSEKTSNPVPYAVVLVRGLARELEDHVTALLFESGAEGVSEDLPFVQKDLRYDPEIVPSALVTLKAYFSSPPSDSDRFAMESSLREVAPDIQFSVALEEHRDWLEEWKKGFVPFVFAEPFWVVPKWCESPAQVAREHVLWMDPGMAFGTGTHETTQLAAAMTVSWMKEKGAGRRVLDVGTGTGILALITERMGASVAIGLDIDPEARRTARENLELNKSLKTKIDDGDISEFASAARAKGANHQFDLVIANIIDGVLLVLAKDLAATLKDGGTMILSGILTDREDEFHRDFAASTGLFEQRRTRKGEWCASIWRKG